ncbi:uncharacterized protein LOC123556827 isoform X2 [Mercenaria mercenaria]|uniref:uncharacterized protein LOC123556827 isoform X2 n=1 Tax=Mercenaria mercenaria TaxID=6596 RepID=UPI00234EF3A1|nr:uncharacterized protein LOC123556827 isoform X2 [Mercenaria mercenaria]
MANTFEKVLNVISKKPDQRQDFEIQGLLPWLRKKSKIFSTLKTDYLKDIVRNCSLGKFRKDDIIIKQGEIGDCFYIILAGKISIYILNKDKDGGSGGSDEKSAISSIGTLNKDGELDRSKLGNFVTSLGSGFPFGEVALVSDDAVRTATIVAEEETDLLVVDRALYNRAVRDVLAEEFEEKQNFIQTNSLFSSWIPKYKKQLTMAMYKETFPYDSVLVKQGDTVGNIYFIISGQVEIRCETSQHVQQYPKLYKLLEDEREKLIKEKKQKRQQDAVENLPPSQKKKESSPKLLKMCYLGKNESLGEIEVLMDMDTYMTTAVCTEKTEVLVLEMKHYERLFVKKHQRTIDTMRRNLEKKLATRTSVLKEYDAVPLLKLLQMKLNLLHNPPPTQEDNMKKKPETSVQIAEKLFFNHQGPLLDMEGPGSVFFMIRARERSKLRRQAHQQERNNTRKGQSNGHVHSIRLPQTLLMAANMAGATDTGGSFQQEVEHDASVSFRTPREHHFEIDTVAQQNVPNGVHEQLDTVKVTNDENGSNVEKTPPFSGALPESMPRTFRRIQSAVKENISRSDDTDHLEFANEINIKTSSTSRPVTRFEKYRTETNLKQLESKVAEWLRKDNPKTVPNVSKLRRLQVELRYDPKVSKIQMDWLQSIMLYILQRETKTRENM